MILTDVFYAFTVYFLHLLFYKLVLLLQYQVLLYLEVNHVSQNKPSLQSALSKFKTRKDYLEYLGEMMCRGKDEVDLSGETRGRPRLLKTYVMEANNGLQSNTEGLDVTVKTTNSGLKDVTWFTLSTMVKGQPPKSAYFLADTSDNRFWLLHTTELAVEAEPFFERLVYSPKSTFDKIWLPINMLNKLVKNHSNGIRGIGLDHTDYFELDPESENAPRKNLTVRASGPYSQEVVNALSEKSNLKTSTATSLVRVRLGDKTDYVYSELTYDGHFSAKGGDAIDAYIGFVEITAKKYRTLIELIERESLGVKKVEGRTLVEGRAFDFHFNRKIENISHFLDTLLSCNKPFRIWGLKNKLMNGVYQVFGVDLHTGDSIDMEVSPSLLRVYLPVGSCGNTILRLYTNLQHYYDSTVTLNDNEFDGAY
jgi:hypothetical protein